MKHYVPQIISYLENVEYIFLLMVFLAASPDGMVLGVDGEKCGLIEIKCPYSCRNLTVLEACCSQQVKSFCCELSK